jgi:hypothetical protein
VFPAGVRYKVASRIVRVGASNEVIRTAGASQPRAGLQGGDITSNSAAFVLDMVRHFSRSKFGSKAGVASVEWLMVETIPR